MLKCASVCVEANRLSEDIQSWPILCEEGVSEPQCREATVEATVEAIHEMRFDGASEA